MCSQMAALSHISPFYGIGIRSATEYIAVVFSDTGHLCCVGASCPRILFDLFPNHRRLTHLLTVLIGSVRQEKANKGLDVFCFS